MRKKKKNENIIARLSCFDKQACVMSDNVMSDSCKHQQQSAEQQQQQQRSNSCSLEQGAAVVTLAIKGTTGTMSAKAAIATTSASFRWLGLRKKRHASTR